MTITSKLIEMYRMQDDINEESSPDGESGWRSQGNNYHRAIHVECAELQDHLAYKWWKKQQVDMKQARGELIDIWHFMLSCDLLNCGPAADIDAGRFAYLTNHIRQLEHGEYALSVIRDSVDDLALAALQRNNEAMFLYFFELMCAFKLSFDDLHIYYVGKNTLNWFRINNGYKDGNYIKVWNGREDNEVLDQIIEDMRNEKSDIGSLSVSEFIYWQLRKRYKFVS